MAGGVEGGPGSPCFMTTLLNYDWFLKSGKWVKKGAISEIWDENDVDGYEVDSHISVDFWTVNKELKCDGICLYTMKWCSIMKSGGNKGVREEEVKGTEEKRVWYVF